MTALIKHSIKAATGLISVLFVLCGTSYGTNPPDTRCKVYVKDTVMLTYQFSDPDPVPSTGKLWPYWRFRTFSDKGSERSWTMVVLENPYLRVKVFPQIGGKVWSIYDKVAGKEMFYDNDVVKFRDISLRGPWTSGGIEFNYGIIGHAPTCAHPVDWDIRNNEDGSVSCFIGASDMLSRSRWCIEINLPADAVWVRTSSTWHNGSREWQPYYTWANSAVKSSEDLMLIYPADGAVGHWGELLTYPLDKEGRDIRYYRNQAYGADKSYHMVGSHKSFFGAYYTDEDRGVMHYALRDEKLGRKYFCWAQSRQGDIWVDLLTDNRPQYIEMQSGRLFNQNFIKSSETSSFRQFLFTPCGTDRWSDYWLPFEGIGPADEVNLNGVVSIQDMDGGRCIGIYPLHRLSGEMVIKDAYGKVLLQQGVDLSPAKAFSVEVKGEPTLMTVGGRSLWRAENGRTDRPKERNPQFDVNSAESRLLLARDMYGMRLYSDSEKKVDSVLADEPANLDALNLKALLLLRRMDYEGALTFTDKALSIDQYNPEAGYTGALASASLGRIPEAMDRLEVAAICNSELRSACHTELARLHFLWEEYDIAADYARKALRSNSDNVTALQILCRCGGCNADAVAEVDYLSHFPKGEKLLAGEITAEQFVSTFKEELPWEDALELASFYSSLGLKSDAATVLEPFREQNILTALWLGWLKGDVSAISTAEKKSIDYVFPFRRESACVLRWAMDNGGGWQSRYLMAMIQDCFGNSSYAASLLDDEETGYAPYYAYRYKFTGKSDDLYKACTIAPDEWIYLKMLGDDLVGKGLSKEAVKKLEPYYRKHSDAIQIGDILMDAYIAEARYHDAEKIVDKIKYLPFEGQKGSHDRYRSIKLHLAAEAIDKGKLSLAERKVNEALLWPERLGVGKPYDNLIDTSTEDWLRSEIEARRANPRGNFAPVTPALERKGNH